MSNASTSAFVVETVCTVLREFVAGSTFEAIVVQTVNRGEDADTTGAIAGMLAGARFGADAIPIRYLDALEPAVRAQIEAQVPRLLAQGTATADPKVPPSGDSGPARPRSAKAVRKPTRPAPKCLNLDRGSDRGAGPPAQAISSPQSATDAVGIALAGAWWRRRCSRFRKRRMAMAFTTVGKLTSTRH